MGVQDLEEEYVRKLGDAIGYGNMMHLAEKVWGDKLEASGEGVGRGGAHAVYCCSFFLVPCGCPNSAKCDWCCGSGRIIAHVKKARDTMVEFIKTAAACSVSVHTSDDGAARYGRAFEAMRAALGSWEEEV